MAERVGVIASTFAAWQELARTRGREPTVDYLWYHMSRGLLPELLYAAGGVEHEFGRIQQAMEEARQWAEQIPELGTSEAETFLGAPSLVTASYCFAHLLVWARAVQERVCRPAKRPMPKGNLGLLPALQPGPLKEQIRASWDPVRKVLKDVRLLANYALHAGALPGGGTPHARIRKDGHLTMFVPDPITAPVATWEEFTYKQELDITEYSGRVMTSVSTFIDEVLDAFEEHRPARIQPPQFS